MNVTLLAEILKTIKTTNLKLLYQEMPDYSTYKVYFLKDKSKIVLKKPNYKSTNKNEIFLCSLDVSTIYNSYNNRLEIKSIVMKNNPKIVSKTIL